MNAIEIFLIVGLQFLFWIMICVVRLAWTYYRLEELAARHHAVGEKKK